MPSNRPYAILTCIEPLNNIRRQEMQYFVRYPTFPSLAQFYDLWTTFHQIKTMLFYAERLNAYHNITPSIIMCDLIQLNAYHRYVFQLNAYQLLTPIEHRILMLQLQYGKTYTIIQYTDQVRATQHFIARIISITYSKEYDVPILIEPRDLFLMTI